MVKMDECHEHVIGKETLLYNSDKKLIGKTVYDENDNIVSSLTYYNNGNPHYEDIYIYSQHDDIDNKPVKQLRLIYYENGKIFKYISWKRPFEKIYEQYKKGEITEKQLYSHQNGYMLDGEQKVYYENGEIKEISIFENGKHIDSRMYKNSVFLNGMYEEIIDGYLTKCNYIDGHKDGELIKYFTAENIYCRCHYTDDILNGACIKYRENGIVASKKIYTNGKLESDKLYYTNGKLMAEYIYNNPTISTYYDIDGSIIVGEIYELYEKSDLPDELYLHLFAV